MYFTMSEDEPRSALGASFPECAIKAVSCGETTTFKEPYIYGCQTYGVLSRSNKPVWKTLRSTFGPVGAAMRQYL